MTTLLLTCAKCSTKLKVPGNLAGKSVKCPKCEAVMKVPAAEPEVLTAVVEPEPVAADPPAAPSDPLGVPGGDIFGAAASAAAQATPAAAAQPLGATPAMRICPHCEAQISATVAKCRFCGEFVNKGRGKKKGIAASKQPVDDTLQPIDYAVSVLLPPVGLGLGFLSLTKGAVQKSLVMIGISGVLTLGIMGVVLYSVFNSAGSVRDTASSGTQMGDFSGYADDGYRRDQRNDEYEYDEDREFGDGEDREFGDGSEDEDEEPTLVRPPSDEDLKNQPPPIQRAMRANVRLVSSGATGEYRGQAVGSGVIIKRSGDTAYILTNRHVLDPLYAEEDGRIGYNIRQLENPDVMYVTGAEEPGKILWFAPNYVDLAVVRAFCPSDGIEVADCEKEPPITIGESVFAVGNPHGIGWSLTKGTVSGLRTHQTATGEVPVVQTDTSINPGNSGGGLYNAQGQLVGINDFIIDPTVATGIGFALRYSLFQELYAANPPE